jgi:hypothetical protein
MATNTNEAKLAAALDLALGALLSVAHFLGKVGSEEASETRSRVQTKVERAQEVLRGGKTKWQS